MSRLQVYKASAGSGKTYQLALKYITLLLGQWQGNRLRLFKGNDLRRHREILAITFTNKATQEMRRRIVKELALLADPHAESGYRRTLHLLVAPDDTALADADVDLQVSQAAEKALDSMLFDFGEMQVSTIDAFFQRVLRSFAYEADLAGNYELMLENDRMTDMAITDMLALACGMKGVTVPGGVDRKYLRDKVSALIRTQVSDGQEYKLFSPDSNLRTELVRFIGHLSDEDYQKKKADIDAFLGKPDAVNRLVDALKSTRGQLHSRMAAEIDSVLSCTAAASLSANARKLLGKLASGAIEELTPTNMAYLLPERNFLKMLNKNKLSNDELADFTSRAERAFETLRSIVTIDILLRNAHFLGLFRDILVVEQSLKAQMNTILLSDTNELLRLIIDDSDTPFIYERIGRRLHHFLIDEFQDTSRMQWANLLPLLSESLGNGNDNLIIGDVKQCIYRFRNSNPELLAHDLDRTPAIRDYLDHCRLDTNWRSAPVVVGFNNSVFEHIGRRVDVLPPKADAYADVCQNASRADVSGYVNVALVRKGSSLDGFDRMIEHIGRQLHSGYSAGDIVVLVRRRSDAHDVVDVLLDAVSSGELPGDTQIVSDEALYVASAASVQWIVAQLQEMNVLPQSAPRVNSRGLPRATRQDIDWLQEHLLTLSRDADVTDPLEQALRDFNERRMRTSADSRAERHREQRASGLSLFEIVEELIRNLPDASWRNTEAQYISAFQDLVLDYCRSKAPTLQGFLKLWDEELADKAAVGLAEGVNAIRVMTIHKSKGLEFNCVHIPIINKVLDEDRNNRWYDVGGFLAGLNLGVEIPRYYPLSPRTGVANVRLEHSAFAAELKGLKDDQTIDEVNALYVAFTRAKQELIITINDPRTESRQDKPLPINHPAGLICPILSEMCRADDDGVWSFGEPTHKYVGKSRPADAADIVLPLEISGYQTRKRENMWSQTKASNITDSGELI